MPYAVNNNVNQKWRHSASLSSLDCFVVRKPHVKRNCCSIKFRAISRTTILAHCRPAVLHSWTRKALHWKPINVGKPGLSNVKNSVSSSDTKSNHNEKSTVLPMIRSAVPNQITKPAWLSLHLLLSLGPCGPDFQIFVWMELSHLAGHAWEQTTQKTLRLNNAFLTASSPDLVWLSWQQVTMAQESSVQKRPSAKGWKHSA